MYPAKNRPPIRPPSACGFAAPWRKPTSLPIIHVTTGPVRARSAALTVQPSNRKTHKVRYAGHPAILVPISRTPPTSSRIDGLLIPRGLRENARCFTVALIAALVVLAIPACGGAESRHRAGAHMVALEVKSRAVHRTL